jgi:hypothetical protein
MTEQMDAIADCIDHGGHVFKLPLHGVRGRTVTALAATAPVDGIDGEVPLQKRKDRSPGLEGTARAVDQDEGHPGAGALKSDRSSVPRHDLFRDASPS